MNIFKAYFTGLKRTVKLPRPVLLIYFVNLILAVLVVFPLFSVLKNEIGNTIIGEDLLHRFTATHFADIYAQILPTAKYFMSQIKWVLLIYWILNVFLAGGIIRTLNQDKFTMTSFFSGAGTNFFRFLGINIIMLLFHILVLLIVYVPTFLIIDSISGSVSSEIVLYRIFGGAILLHLILMYILLMIADYAKFYAVLYNSKNIFKSVAKGFKYVFGNFLRTTGLYFLLIILPIGLVIGYFLLDIKIDTHIGIGILIAFLIQQAFIFLRIWFRIWIYSSPLQMYTADFLKDENVQEKLSLMQTWDRKAKEQQMITNYNIASREDNIISEEEIIKKIKKEEIENLKQKSKENDGKNMLDILKEEENAKDTDDNIDTEDKNSEISIAGNNNVEIKDIEVNNKEIGDELIEINENEEIIDASNKYEKKSNTVTDKDGDVIPIDLVDDEIIDSKYDEEKLLESYGDDVSEDEFDEEYNYIHKNEEILDLPEDELPIEKNKDEQLTELPEDELTDEHIAEEELEMEDSEDEFRPIPRNEEHLGLTDDDFKEEKSEKEK